VPASFEFDLSDHTKRKEEEGKRKRERLLVFLTLDHAVSNRLLPKTMKTQKSEKE